MTEENHQAKLKLGDRLFPPRYDFNGMLENQANEIVKGVREFVEWLKVGDGAPLDEIAASERKADQIRHEMEQLLQEAFSTPFDRQDIYSISRQMDQVMNFSYSTAIEMAAFKVDPDPAIRGMAQSLLDGMIVLAAGVHMMHGTVHDPQGMISEIRRHAREVEGAYVESMSLVFRNDDAITAMKKREVYHHLRDAARNLNSTVDILHRII
ncbi:MAG: DUF47 family protein, partial [Methanomassiliicoccales archaeon]|nr:DUF47 family protein [Methanomassiliicoccales archaeon]